MHLHESTLFSVYPGVHNYNYGLLQDSETPFEMKTVK